jgi:hypothetical protein
MDNSTDITKHRDMMEDGTFGEMFEVWNGMEADIRDRQAGLLKSPRSS